MAFFSLHAYDADVWIPQFKGLNQADIGLSPDLRFATEAENVETKNGVLQPQAANIVMDGPDGDDTPRIETLAVFHRRWYEGEGSKNWYICCAGGKFYQKQEGTTSWDVIPLPVGIDAFQNSVWSWVTYEETILVDPEDTDSAKTVDIILLSNAKDGMYKIVPPDAPTTWNVVENYTWNQLAQMTWNEVLSARWAMLKVDTRTNPEDPDEPQKNFAVIERFGERIWGCGVPDEPDRLYYSKAFQPEDWTPDLDIPEDGSGYVDQPTWDGDQFYALKRFGDQLLAFKRNKVWRIMGYSPGEYTFHEQYGRGTEYFNTIAVMGERCLMATKSGVMIYDGMDTNPYGKEQVEQLWKMVNLNALDQMCGAIHDKKYYLSFPTGDSVVNNALLVYDFNEGSILYYPDMMIEAFLPANDELYATSSSLPGKLIQFKSDSWSLSQASGNKSRWVTPWMDFGYKRINKGGFDLYFLPEVQNEAVTFTISVQTEKKAKTKQYICQPLSDAQRAIPKEHRVKKLHFGGSGRKFRVIIEAETTAPWRLIGGIQMVVETDPD